MSVVVTGAAGGIGAACVEAFLGEGRHVIGFDAEDGSAADDHHVLDLSSESCGDEVLRLFNDHDVEVLSITPPSPSTQRPWTPAPRAGIGPWP